MTLRAEPLTAEAFAPYGEVIETPADGRNYYERALSTTRPHAHASLSVATKAPEPPGALTLKLMERHEHSSQSFVPLGTGRWVVVVAPGRTDADAPDMARARLFLPGPGQGVTYARHVWHHPMTTLDKAQSFAVFMWNDGTAADTTFIDIEPMVVEV